MNPLRVNPLIISPRESLFEDEYERKQFITVCERAARERLSQSREEDQGKSFETLLYEIVDARMVYARDWINK